MTVGSTLALFMPSLAAYLVLRLFWSRSKAPLSRALAASMAPGLGIGFASSLYFVLLLLVRNHRAAVRLDAAFWLIAAAWLLAVTRRRTLPSGSSPGDPDEVRGVAWRPAVVVTAAGCLILLALAGIAFWRHWAVNPHGEWDAFAIWNLRARSIFRGAEDWSILLSPAIAWSKPDYPLLLPLTVARLWGYAGREGVAAPAVVAMLFSLSSIAVVVIGVGSLRGWPTGLLSGMAMLMARTYVFQSSCQCADVPLGFFVLVAICFVAMSREEADPAPLLLTAGAAAGLAAWTKNEGIVMLGLVWLVSGFAMRSFRAMAQVAAGSAVPVLTLAIFKLGLAPPSNYLFGLQDAGGIVAKLAERSRWITVTDRFVDLVPAWGQVSGGAIVSLGLAVALTARPDRRSLGRAALGLMLVTAMLLGYGLVYVVTPLPLEWQIATSFDRLLTQLWPGLVWAAFQISSSGPRRDPRQIT